MGKLSILKEFWDFIRINKKWVLAPIILILLGLSILIFCSSNPAVAPFIYTLF